MAFNYEHTPVLSKIKIGSDYYYVKDADLRSVVDGFNATIVGGTVGLVTDNNGSFVTAANIKSYVDQMVSIGLVIEVVSELPTPAADYMGKLYLVSQSGGKTGDAYDEYVIVRSGAGTEADPYTYAWEKIGDTRIDLSNYVTNVSYADATHTLQQTKNGTTSTVHAFGAMADADTGTGTISTVDSASFTYTPAGTIKLDNAAQGENNKVLKGGSIAVTLKDNVVSEITSVGTLPTKAADTFVANVPTALDLTKFNGGSKAADTFVAPSLTTATKALYKQGIKAEVGTGADAECLVFSNVDKEADIDVVDSFSAGSFTEGAFTAASLASGFYTVGSAASYTEGAFTQGTLPQMADKTVAVNTATFTGTEGVLSFAGTEEANHNVSLTATNKTITVNPTAGE